MEHSHNQFHDAWTQTECQGKGTSCWRCSVFVGTFVCTILTCSTQIVDKEWGIMGWKCSNQLFNQRKEWWCWWWEESGTVDQSRMEHVSGWKTPERPSKAIRRYWPAMVSTLDNVMGCHVWYSLPLCGGMQARLHQICLNSSWDGNVPVNHKTNDNPPRALGWWINRQQYAYGKGNLK